MVLLIIVFCFMEDLSLRDLGLARTTEKRLRLSFLCFCLVDEASEKGPSFTLMTGQKGPFRHFGEFFSKAERSFPVKTSRPESNGPAKPKVFLLTSKATEGALERS